MRPAANLTTKFEPQSPSVLRKHGVRHIWGSRGVLHDMNGDATHVVTIVARVRAAFLKCHHSDDTILSTLAAKQPDDRE